MSRPSRPVDYYMRHRDWSPDEQSINEHLNPIDRLRRQSTPIELSNNNAKLNFENQSNPASTELNQRMNQEQQPIRQSVSPIDMDFNDGSTAYDIHCYESSFDSVDSTNHGDNCEQLSTKETAAKDNTNTFDTGARGDTSQNSITSIGNREIARVGGSVSTTSVSVVKRDHHHPPVSVPVPCAVNCYQRRVSSSLSNYKVGVATTVASDSKTTTDAKSTLTTSTTPVDIATSKDELPPPSTSSASNTSIDTTIDSSSLPVKPPRRRHRQQGRPSFSPPLPPTTAAINNNFISSSRLNGSAHSLPGKLTYNRYINFTQLDGRERPQIELRSYVQTKLSVS